MARIPVKTVKPVKKMNNKNNKKMAVYLLIGVALFLMIVFYFGFSKNKSHHLQDVKIDGEILIPALTMNDFNLTATNGKSFNNDSLKGRWTMVFFGFTNCPSLCPSTLSQLNKMYQVLQKELPAEQLPQVVLVSVDPERDSIAKMTDYLAAFNKDFIGARADLPVTEAFEKQLHVAAGKMKLDNKGNYTVNHSAEIMLFNPEGQLQAYLAYPHVAEQMIRDYKAIVTAS